ncbi:hypothetical protein KDK92_01355 [Oceanirhabdus seepicola]|uniref:DUF3327 domain-containing protein n=2 Tax=Oceanirhabdus seepicola TaxID=2828781 RepID=A0A9J6NVT4_9CLOT|nr:hypothetical protein [Oceanirhabdus seepicola]
MKESTKHEGNKYSELESAVIMDLKEKIEKGDTEALQEFWNNLENKGTPIIEEIEGDSENALVTFIYKEDYEIDNVVVLIPPFEVEKKLEKLLDTNLWYKTCKMRNDLRFIYDFSVNDPLDGNFHSKILEFDRLNKNKLPAFNGNPYVVMPNAPDNFWTIERDDVPKGKLDEHKYYSEKLDEQRSIKIYTPNGYSKENKPYGYLVLTDGGAYIEFLSAVTVLDNLIADKKIPPMVAVFVETHSRRSIDMTYNDEFSYFLAQELVPWMKNNYNISDNLNEAIMGGTSLGGLNASYVGLKYPDTFGNVLSQSGAYYIKPTETDEDNWLAEQFNSKDKLPMKIYLDIGILESKEMIDSNLYFRDTLIGKGYSVHLEEFKSGHDYLSWGETLAKGLIWLIGTE